ncbi:hypothetical protein J5X84_42540 [Streptosporangiaceae bacterium NEAU-GS5]|nr:hypothetical protein [Streptosporangiaceae bacterium NEAU-GS5]
MTLPKFGRLVRLVRISTPMRPALAVGIFWTGVMLARLFLGGAIGLADQGDGKRLLCTLGAANQRPWNADMWNYIYTTWIPHTWYGETCGADGSGEDYHSTQLGLLWMAKLVTRMLGLPGVIDTRALGVVCAVLVGVVCAALVRVLPGTTAMRAGVASAVALVYADSAFAGFFVSPYAEPAALLGAGATIVAMLALWRRGRATYLMLALVTVAGLATILAKIQLASYALPIAVALVWLPHRGSNRWLPRAHRLIRAVARRGPGITMALLLVMATAATLAQQPKRQMEVALYDVVFGSLLHDDPHARADLADLGVDPALAAKEDTNILSPGSAALTPQYDAFKDRVTMGTIARFYLTHPGQTFRAVGWGLRAVADLDLDYLGSYPPDAGMPPRAKEHRIRVYGTVWNVFRLLPILLIVLWAWVFWVGVTVVRRRRPPAETAVGRLAVIVPFMIVTQFAAVLLGEGRIEATRHLTHVSFLTACCIPILVMALWVRSRGRIRTVPWQSAPGMPKPTCHLASR